MGPVFSRNFSEIINHIIETESFLEIWKILKDISVHKSGSVDKEENYRPISLLCALSRKSEEIFHLRMIKFATKFNILSSKQFGFQSNFNCISAISDLTESIRSSFNNTQCRISCLLDMKKAFCTVDHEVILHELEQLSYRSEI